MQMRKKEAGALAGCGVLIAFLACIWLWGTLDTAVAAGCPNEAFRPDEAKALALGLASAGANLPDCRAFEQSTPVDKDGGDATATVPYAKASTTGGGVTFISKSGIPGGVGAQDFPSYLASRGEAAWSTHGLLPPAIEGQGAELLGWTPDFSEVFTEVTRFGSLNQTELLVRPGTSGPPTKVVDYTVGLEPHFVGTTEDGSLLFESPAKLTKGAAPGQPNVYLWEHDSGEVVLAGVLNGGSAPSQGAIAGPYDWIRGTNSATLGEGGGTRDYYTEEEHAIARDGSAVFFTAAGSGKLYERLNPGEEQSALDGEGECTKVATAKACTLKVSASQKTNGNGPGKTELGGPRPAAFQAASADGKVSYFTSQEELTNKANTGPEPTELPPQPFISLAKVGPSKAEEIEHTCIPARASGLATDSTYIYWADAEAGAIGRANLDCKEAPDPTFITGLAGVEDVAVGAGHIYWTEPGNNTIGRAEADGNPASVEADFITGASVPKGVAVGGGFLYWTNEKGLSLGRARDDGSEVDQDFIDFSKEVAGQQIPTQGVVVDPTGGHIYVALGNVYIRSYGLDGKKDPAEIALSKLAGDVDLAVDGTYIYWSEEGTEQNVYPSRIGRAKLDLSEVIKPFIEEGEGVEHAQSAAAQGGNIYWANDPPPASKPGNDLYRYEAETGTLEDITADTGDANGAEVQGVLGASEDGSVVYFAANGDLDGPEGATPGNCAGTFGSMSGECNLYRWEAGDSTPRLVARLGVGGNEDIGDAADWAATPTKVFFSVNFQKTAQVSASGEALLFRSQLKLTSYKNEGTPELYLYRVGAGLACVSCNPEGEAPAGKPDLGDVFPGTNTIPPRPASLASHNLAGDGKRVFFETPDALVEADTNGEGGCPLTPGQFAHRSCIDVYEWEAPGTGTCEESSLAYSPTSGGCLYLLSTGKSTEPALLADASESGDDVYFFTRARLVSQDKEELMDVYDVRAGGGLATQYPSTPPPPCESTEACHEAPPAPPGQASPATPGFFGPGNAKPSHGKKRKGKKHHRKAHAKRRTGR
jgi:hypothetical protein